VKGGGEGRVLLLSLTTPFIPISNREEKRRKREKKKEETTNEGGNLNLYFHFIYCP